MGLALDMALKFYASATKGFKLKVREILGLIFTFVEVTVGKTGKGRIFAPSPTILNRVNGIHENN